MKALNLFIAMTAVMLAATVSQAQISLGQPAYGGSGCPGGSASATLTPDGSILSILFDQFIVEAGNTTGRRIDRKNCSLRIPVNVASGYQVSLIAFDYRGFVALPWGAQAVFDANYSYVGSAPVRFTKTFKGSRTEDYTLRNELISQTVTWSPCGRQVMLVADASARVISNSSMQQTLMSVDSVDVSAGLLYKVQWRRCY